MSMRGLILPALCPITKDLRVMMATTVRSIANAFYSEVKSFSMYDFMYGNLIGKRRKKRMGSFGVLSDSYEGHDVVFLHPFEVFTKLQCKIVKASEEGVEVLDFKDLVGSIGTGSKFNEFLAKLWLDAEALVFSNYIAEAVIDNLSIKRIHDMPYQVEYCYGRIKRIVRKQYVEDLVKNSKLVAKVNKISDAEERTKVVYTFLFLKPTRWPWSNVGLLIDRARKWVTLLNGDTADFVNVDDLEELRIMTYEGREIPIIIVTRLTLSTSLGKKIEEVFRYGTSKSLGDLLIRVTCRQPPLFSFPWGDIY